MRLKYQAHCFKHISELWLGRVGARGLLDRNLRATAQNYSNKCILQEGSLRLESPRSGSYSFVGTYYWQSVIKLSKDFAAENIIGGI